jgi:hypothetical protein
LVVVPRAGLGHITRVLVQEALIRWLAEGVKLKDVVNLAFHKFFDAGTVSRRKAHYRKKEVWRCESSSSPVLGGQMEG